MSAPVMAFDFCLARQQFSETLEKVLRTGKAEDADKAFQKVSGSEAEKRNTIDQSFRDVLKDLVLSDSPCEVYKQVVTLAIHAVEQELCSPSTPFLMLSDLFNSIILEKCDEVFYFVEEGVSTWKSELFYSAGKNYLLRMCNDLLRRLSKSQNTVFCGRIQLFLARLFPLDEKSGLNLMSQFNIENTTSYNTKPEDYSKHRQSVDSDRVEESMDIEEGEMEDLTSGSIPIDYNLYRKFWMLQDYFRVPTQCYEKVAWKAFSSHSDDVLSAFDSYKLDDVKSQRRKSEIMRRATSQSFFAKYLTSEKLLDLQLSDSNFRRYVLVQFLILFQYLTSTVKFKLASQVLTDDQTTWIKSSTDTVYKLLRETPPEGEQFAKAVEHILSREENWNNWKNEGCPSYVREKSEPSAANRPPRMGRKRTLGEDIKASGGKLVKMGSAELTRLWNLSADNMEACRAEQRVFLPTMEDYFEEAIEQADPEAMVEEEYKLVNHDTYSWKALRLLSRRSPHFFAQSSMPLRKISAFLDDMISKLAKEIPSSNPQEEVKTEVAEEEEALKEDPSQGEELLSKNEDQANEKQAEVVSVDQKEALSSKLGADWRKLATELNFPEDDIAYIESETKDTSAQASKMLTLWQENEGERATPGCLQQALREIGLVAIAVSVFGTKKNR